MNRPLMFVFLLFLPLNYLLSQCSCEPISVESLDTVFVNSVSGLEGALDQANNNDGNLTIILDPGTYQLNDNLRFISDNMSHLTILGSTGNPDDVIIKGKGWNNSDVTHIFNVAADHFTLAHVTIGEVYYHPIQVHSNPSDADDFLVQNVKFVDAKEQLLKVSGGGAAFADRGQVLCCTFEFTSGIAYQYYTGGIDAHRAKDWIVKYNLFKHIRSPEANLAEHAIHFWRESNGTHVEANQIINCDRGIGFGLGGETASGHVGGIIMNNFVHCSRDVGIGLESASDAKVYNNTVVVENYFNSIEYRFETTTNAHIVNNLVNESISDRSSGSSGTLQSNYEFTDYSIFVNAVNYDYHITGHPQSIVEAGAILNAVIKDYDCESRSTGSGYDIGADAITITTADVVLENTQISLYPNPTPGYFTIDGVLGNYDICVLDNQGATHTEYNRVSGTVQIDISDLPNGLYFVQIAHKSLSPVYLKQILKM